MMIFGVTLIIHEAGATEECFTDHSDINSILGAPSCVAITTLSNVASSMPPLALRFDSSFADAGGSYYFLQPKFYCHCHSG
ncbi:hypothetical protein H5410_052029 [Solanum commersonii]|uniref:Uncharacterized protein n=1 Tax=Solanum commersonii TaxID=4109 RepID=A0A9J5X085_SOLCO|nr:hypothetical protein H5410_052029 [Solanum commersonii]